jgi:predicted amidohydrolase
MSQIRLSAACFKAGIVDGFDDFAEHVSRLTNQAAHDRPDFLIFPELLTLEIMNSFENTESPEEYFRLASYTDAYLDLFTHLAKEKGFYIVGGSHLREFDGKLYNTSHLFTPDGQVMEQQKCHLFPDEVPTTTPGDRLAVFETEKVKLSLLTCYDLEFPEAARLVAVQGAELLLSPSATASVHGYWRVRHCAQARCVENQVFVAHCSLLGTIDDTPFYGAASILTPCDGDFPEKGIAAESAFNEEAIATADIDTDMLYEIRKSGAATTFINRRWDILDALYHFESTSPNGSKPKTN